MAKGNIEMVLLALVALVALIGIIMTLRGSTAGAQTVPLQDQGGAMQLPMMDCQQHCSGRDSENRQVSQPLGGSELRACLAQCAQQMGVDQP